MIKLNKLLIDNIDYSDYAVWTFQGQNTLDESLDMQYIELKGTDVNAPFKPFSNATIEIEDNVKVYTYNMYVESDTVTEVMSNHTFNHNLLFIEQTKRLERVFVEKTIRQPLIKDYGELVTNIFFDVKRRYTDDFDKLHIETASNYINLMNGVVASNKPLTIKNPAYIADAIADLTGLDLIDLPLIVNMDIINPYGEVVKQESAQTSSEFIGTGYIPQWDFQFTPTEEGDYTFKLTDGYNLESYGFEITFHVSVLNEYAFETPKEKYTIRDTIEMLLQTCITLRVNEKNIYHFRLANTNEYEGVSTNYRKRVNEILDSVSPEFTFNKMSLFEALKMVGDYGHFIPRLQDNKIYLDLLGQMEYADVDSLGDCYSNVESQASNDFCNALDSKVSNLTNMDNIEEGSVSTPDNKSFRTLRAESGVAQITDTNIIIPTEYNIESIQKLEIGYLSDGTFVGDITPYVYEESEYNTLSSFGNSFPTAKMFALKYKQGSKNITELSFKRQNPISSAFEDIAIKNIICRKLGKDINWWNSLFSTEDVFQLQYKLIYTPSTDTKVTQFKSYKDDISGKDLYIAYNQGASKVSSNAYGENLKGTIAKMGNVAKTKMYILPSLDLLPKCGTLFDKDYYISVVKYEVYPNFIKCELGLSKNFNNKSAYVEINSQLEFFEYDRNITIDRYVVYEDFCEVGDDTDTGWSTNSIITDDGLVEFENSFVSGHVGNQVGLVKAQGTGYGSTRCKAVYLPVISLGVGNSLLFSFKYEDSVSAGTTAYYLGGTRYQKLVKYVDIYGELETLRVELGSRQYEPANYDDSVVRGDKTPLADDSYNAGGMLVYFDTYPSDIYLKKSVSEIPHITYQIHFVSNKPDLIIGSGLAKKSAFVTNETLNYKLYLLKNPINKFESKINLTNATEFGTITTTRDLTNKKIKINDFVAPTGDYVGWAIVQTYNNQNVLIIGENKIIQGGDTVSMPTFKFKRRIK